MQTKIILKAGDLILTNPSDKTSSKSESKARKHNLSLSDFVMPLGNEK